MPIIKTPQQRVATNQRPVLRKALVTLRDRCPPLLVAKTLWSVFCALSLVKSQVSACLLFRNIPVSNIGGAPAMPRDKGLKQSRRNKGL